MNNNFSLLKRAKSFTHAGRGIRLFLKTTHNAWLHVCIFLLAIILGITLHISSSEWISILLASGFVFTAEAFNSAIEIDMDLTSPDFHPSARDTKDVAAGAVLIAACTAFIVGLFVFIPHIF